MSVDVRKNAPLGHYELDEYAGVMERLHAACEARGANFRRTLAGLAEDWMAGGGREGRRQKDESETATPKGLVTAMAATTTTGGGTVLERAIALLQDLQRLTAELAGLGIVLAPGVLLSVTPAAPPAEPGPAAAARRPADVPVSAARESAAARQRKHRATAPPGSPTPRATSNRGRRLVTADLPGESFTAEQVRARHGLASTVPLGSYVAKGYRIGGRSGGHVYTYATDPAAAGAEAAAPVEVKPPPAEGRGEAGLLAAIGGADDDKVGWRCRECEFVMRRSVPPSKCKRCDGRRFNRVAEPAPAA